MFHPESRRSRLPRQPASRQALLDQFEKSAQGSFKILSHRVELQNVEGRRLVGGVDGVNWAKRTKQRRKVERSLQVEIYIDEVRPRSLEGG